jgi:hypothetical protein
MSALRRFGVEAKKWVRWLLALCRWLLEPRLFWITVFALGIAVIAAIWLRSEPAFRWVGLSLQLIGVFTVARNIRDTGEQFDRPGFLALAAQWLRRRPRIGSSVTALSGGAAGLAVSGGKARADIWHNASSGADLEARLDAVEKNLTRVRDQLHELEQQTDKRLEQQVNALEQEKQVRAKVDEDVLEKLKTSAVRGLHISTVGVVCLFMGMIMSTGSIEWAKLSQRFIDG